MCNFSSHIKIFLKKFLCRLKKIFICLATFFAFILKVKLASSLRLRKSFTRKFYNAILPNTGTSA